MINDEYVFENQFIRHFSISLAVSRVWELSGKGIFTEKNGPPCFGKN
jgi:hypothetical protein